MSQKYKIVDFSWGMNTIESDYNIALKDSVLLRNMTTEWNRAITLPWFTKVLWDWEDWQVQWWATNWSIQVYIHNNNLYYHDLNNWASWKYENAVWVWVKWTESNDEDYNILIYKDHIVITNSLKSWESTLNCEWENPKLFKIEDYGTCTKACNASNSKVILTKQEFPCLLKEKTPVTSIIHNWILYFWGGVKWSWEENLIYWGGLEFLQAEFEWIKVSRSRLFDFCRVLSADLNDWSDLWNPIPWGQYIWDWEPITSFFSNWDSLFVGKRNSIYRLNAIFDISNTVYTWLRHIATKSTDTWIKNQEVVHNVHWNTIYYDGTHIRILQYDTSSSTLEDLTPSDKVRWIINKLPKKQNFATSLYTYPLLKFFLRDSEKQYWNNIALVYNVEEKSWSIQDWINLFHAWSWYDNNNDKVQWFWGSDSDNTIYQDWIGHTWWDEPRTFDFIWRMYNFWDSVSYKTLDKVNFSMKIWPDVELSMNINTLKVQNKLVKKSIWKVHKYKSVNVVKNTTTATWMYWNNQFGSYWEYNSDNTNLVHFPMVQYTTWKWFQPHIHWEWYWYFELQYMDLYLSAKQLNKYIS